MLGVGSALTHEPFSIYGQSHEPGFRRKIHKDFNLASEGEVSTKKVGAWSLKTVREDKGRKFALISRVVPWQGP